MGNPSRADVAGRQAVMRICAEAARDELDGVLSQLHPVSDTRDIRKPESGLVMLRGRMGGDGAPFNLGEATVTRAAVALDDDGPPGFAYHLGRDRTKARAAAIIDALWQVPERRPRVEAALEPINERLLRTREQDRRRTAATRVDFFTLVRGED